MRPRIGITTSTLDRSPEGAIQRTSSLPSTYARSVYLAGGVPLILPSLPDTCDDPDDLLQAVDGIIFSGGGDIDPVYWNEPPHPSLSFMNPARDAFEIPLVRAALERDMPMLGICRGLQVMTVATGGDLWQDLPSQNASTVAHRQTAPRHMATHEVAVVPETLLAHMLWPDKPGIDRLPVNSFHHQAPRNCGTLFQVVASSPDGVIEALAVPDAHFALGVQWHPEEMAETDLYQLRIFASLVAAARERSRIGQP